MQDKDLEGLFALAARDRPTPSPALMDRVLADALALQPPPVRIAARPMQGSFARFAALFGGGPVLAGLCSAAIAGVALGYMQPGAVEFLTGGLAGAGAETLELFPSVDFLTNEG